MCDYESVQTYYPRFTEEHSDSSDFESPIELKKLKKNKLFLNKELLRKVWMKEIDLYMKNHVNCDDYGNKIKMKHPRKKIQVPDRYKKSDRKSESMEKVIKSFQKKHQDESRSEIVLRDKVITRFSNIFRHINNKDKYKAIEKTPEKNDHACQVYSKNVYELKRQIETPYNTTKIVNYSAQQIFCNVNRKNNTYAVFPLYSSSSSELDVVTLDSKEHQENTQLPNEYKKNKYERQIDKQTKISYIYPKNRDYQVFPGLNSQSKDVSTSYCDDSFNNARSRARSSIFWEYMINKIEQKCRQQRIVFAQHCYCGQVGCEAKKTKPASCTNNKDPYCGICCSSSDDANPQKHQGLNENMSTRNKRIQCQCSAKDAQNLTPGQDRRTWQQDHDFVTKTTAENYNGEIPALCTNNKDPYCGICCSSSDDANPQKHQGLNENMSTRNKIFQCQCPSEDAQNLTPVQDRITCQQDHDFVTKTIAEKYNGEILCIHNPPCILINGCFKVGAKETGTAAWYVAQDGNNGFQQSDKVGSNKNGDSHGKYIDIMQYYKEEDRIEKEMQSVCHHNPPCEFVRQCCKPKYSPKLDSCCVHVPMCRKVPECLLGSEDCGNGEKACKHKPKCHELPLCAKDWEMYGKISNVESEVKRVSDMVCQHHPPCIKIPKCLGRMMCEGNIPFNAIPDCAHQPACDRIPACFRKTPKMISTSSQYPAPCRIV